MNDIERCNRMAAFMAYERMATEKRRPLADRVWDWALPVAVVWGIMAFCVVLMESRKWVF